jgi:hypothetical protein
VRRSVDLVHKKNEKDSVTPRFRKTILWSCSCLALIVVSLFAISAILGDPRLRSKARKEWKDCAIVDIAKKNAAQPEIANEIRALRMGSPQSEEGWWVGTNVLVMTNGEHLVYSQVCSKENSGIYDIFIARGSDGKWYYSTYHFCVRMLDLRLAEAPSSLQEFSKNYFTREFDGKSDECLQRTWPPKK